MPGELADTWSAITALLHLAVDDSAYGIWLEPLIPLALEHDTLTVAAPDEARGWVADRFARVLQTSATAVLGPDVTVEIVSRSQIQRGSDGSRAREPSRFKPGAGLNPKYTFDQFVIGDSNHLAHAAALAVAETPGQAYNPLFIHGPPGLGKTHLLHSIGAYIAAHGGGLSVRYTTVEAFMNHFIAALQSGSMGRFKAAYRGSDVLLVDDIQFLGSKAKTEEELFHTFNELYELGSQLVLAADRLPREIVSVQDRLRERFEAGLVVDVRPPDFAVRLTILRKRACLDEVVLADPSALEVIADRVTTNVRALEGTLIRLVAFHSLTGRPIDGALASEVLDRLGGARRGEAGGPPRSVRDIQDAVCALFDLTHDELVSRSKAARVAWPRQIGMYLSRELTDQSLPTIGTRFGGRSHATVLHACKRTADRMRADRDAYDAVNGLLGDLGDRDR
ncbi:chromosomal replication initiator protein DnaA [soil metagenome]